MSLLAACHFDTDDGAERSGRALQDPPSAARAMIHDAALVSWALGAAQPATRPMPELAAGDEALGEGFWGLLFGLMFYSPLLGAAVGSATGALSGSFADFGIHDTFVNRVRDTVTPGTSELFLLGSETVVEEVHRALHPRAPVKVLTARLTPLQEGSLREIFVG